MKWIAAAIIIFAGCMTLSAAAPAEWFRWIMLLVGLVVLGAGLSLGSLAFLEEKKRGRLPLSRTRW